MGKEQVPKEITLKVDYVRKFPCAVCKKPVTASRLLHGYLIKCDCVPVLSKGMSIEDHSWWEKVTSTT